VLDIYDIRNCCIGRMVTNWGTCWDNPRHVSSDDIQRLSGRIDGWRGGGSSNGEFSVAFLKKAVVKRHATALEEEGWVRVTQWMGGRIALFVRRNGGKHYASRIARLK